MHTYLYDCRNCGKPVDTSVASKSEKTNPAFLEMLMDHVCSYECYLAWEKRLRVYIYERKSTKKI